MKAIIKTISAFALVLTVHAALAARTDDGLFTKDYAVARYVAAITQGNIDGFAEVLDTDAKFCTMGKTIKSTDKKTLLSYLAHIGKLKQLCSTSTTVIEDNPQLTVVKVDMQYETFVRSNYVTVAHTATGWKITNVCSVFK